MENKVKGFLKRKQEMVFIISLSVIITMLMVLFLNIPKIYQENSLGSLLLSIFGTLFGLLLTSYAILFGLIPVLSIDTLETSALENVNFRFFISLISNLLIITLGLGIIFLGYENNWLLYIQIFLVIFSVLMFFLLIFYLFVLFKGAKNKAIKKGKKFNLS